MRASALALEAIPGDDPQVTAIMADLAGDFYASHRLTGDADRRLQGADLQGRLAANSGHPGWAKGARVVCLALTDMYAVREDPDLIDEALRHGRLAIAEDEDADALMALSEALYVHHQRTGDPGSLTEAIELSHRMMELAETDPRLRLDAMYGHSLMLSVRFQQRGDPADLDEACTLVRAVVEEGPEDPVTLAAAVHAMVTRYRVRGEVADLHSALAWGERALRLKGTPRAPARAFSPRSRRPGGISGGTTTTSTTSSPPSTWPVRRAGSSSPGTGRGPPTRPCSPRSSRRSISAPATPPCSGSR